MQVFIEVRTCSGLQDKQFVAIEEQERQFPSQLRQAATCRYLPIAQLVQVVGVPEQDRQLASQFTQELLKSMAVIGQEVQVLELPEQLEQMGEQTLQLLSVMSCSGRVQEVQ